MRVLLTGASSFTGWWFAKRLVEAGHEVAAPLTSSPDAYEGQRLARLRSLPPGCRIREAAAFGSEPFVELVDEGWDVLCHHGARTRDYKASTFDVTAAFAANTCRMNEVLDRFAAAGGRAVVVTGSVFEADEGAGTEPRAAFSPYGVSKTITWHAFRYAVPSRGLALAKFTISNPFGPMEDERFTSYLWRSWLDDRTPEVRTPDYVRDNIHVSLLSLAYAHEVQRVATAPGGSVTRLNPSGYVESQGAFALRYAAALSQRWARPCPVRLLPQQRWEEPLVRINSEPASVTCPAWSEAESWDEIARYAVEQGTRR